VHEAGSLRQPRGPRRLVRQGAAPSAAVAVSAAERRSGAPFHPVLTRQGHPHGFCLECSTALEPWEGQAGAREYHFAAREVGQFTNRARLAKLLQLMALDLRGQADSRQWADRLREQLYLAGGRPATHQRTADDPHGAWSLLA
jgi:hypothetical protein